MTYCKGSFEWQRQGWSWLPWHQHTVQYISGYYLESHYAGWGWFQFRWQTIEGAI